MSRSNLSIIPRAWQTAALTRWSLRRRGIAEVVTGGGKTSLGVLCAADFLSVHRDGHVIIVVPTIALLDQWIVEIRSAGLFQPSEIGAYSGGIAPRSPLIRCHVMTLVAAREAAPAVAARALSMLLVDECHRIASRANAAGLTGDYVATLGLSATPEREYDDLFDEVVVPALGEVIFEYTYSDALRDGVISPFSLENIQVPLTDTEKSDYNRLTRSVGIALRQQHSGEDVGDALVRLLRQRAAVAANASFRVPVAVRLMDDYRGLRTIVFHERISAADAIAEGLAVRGHRVARYHSGLGSDLRRSELSLYRDGLVDVLVTCRALDEGLDVPNTEVALIASSTASKRQRIQRVGRALRPKAGSAQATVITLYATRQERERLEADEQSIGASLVTWRFVSTQENDAR
jgi:superfamily II DNA or RNA helicase